MATQAQAGPNVQPMIGKPVKVNVWAWTDTDGTVRFDHDWAYEGEPKSPNKKIDVPKGAPPTEIQFHFDDRTDPKLHLKFYPTPAGAIYVGMAKDGCPKVPGDAGQFDLNDPPSKSTPNLLKVIDMNSAACELKYTLRFDGDSHSDSNGQHPPYEYDPDLRNGGHGGPVVDSFWTTPTVVIATVAVVSVAALAIVFLNR